MKNQSTIIQNGTNAVSWVRVISKIPDTEVFNMSLFEVQFDRTVSRRVEIANNPHGAAQRYSIFNLPKLWLEKPKPLSVVEGDFPTREEFLKKMETQYYKKSLETFSYDFISEYDFYLIFDKARDADF